MRFDRLVYERRRIKIHLTLHRQQYILGQHYLKCINGAFSGNLLAVEFVAGMREDFWELQSFFCFVLCCYFFLNLLSSVFLGRRSTSNMLSVKSARK